MIVGACLIEMSAGLSKQSHFGLPIPFLNACSISGGGNLKTRIEQRRIVNDADVLRRISMPVAVLAGFVIRGWRQWWNNRSFILIMTAIDCEPGV